MWNHVKTEKFGWFFFSNPFCSYRFHLNEKTIFYIDIMIICTIFMPMKHKIFSSSEKRSVQRPKHAGLTHYLRRHWHRTPETLRAILARCDVAANVGVLPPQLRKSLSPYADIARVTMDFHDLINDFLVDSSRTIHHCHQDIIYELPAIGALFNATCKIECHKTSGLQPSRWSGLAGVVCRMSFPELNASYALKVYFPIYYDSDDDHGAMYEIPTALAACRSEPRDNMTMYMASLTRNPYMLSQWGGDQESCWIRQNTNQIFFMSRNEEAPRNYRNGRRIDYGETYRTLYGCASWRARKIYRSLCWRIENNDVHGAKLLVDDILSRDADEMLRDDYEMAMRILRDKNSEYLNALKQVYR